MILKTDQLLKFSQFCKENELFFSSDRLSDLIIFLKKNHKVKEFYDENINDYDLKLSGSGSCMSVSYTHLRAHET